MAALKLKERWDEYKQVSTDEEGRVALSSPPLYRDHDNDGEEGVGLLDTEITVTRPTRPKRNCCVCCGLNCGLFWKAFGIVVGLFILWYGIKLVWWAVTPSPTGLESMPTYGTSLGCVNAPHIYDPEKSNFRIPVGSSKADHGMDIKGGAVGTIVIAEGPADSTAIEYKVTIRSDDKSLLDKVALTYGDEDDGRVDSRLLISTPRADPTSSSCLRYDVTMYVPSNLKRLHVAAHTVTHVQFDPESHIELDEFFVTLYKSSPDNMILPHKNVHSKEMTLEVFRGWIVGDAAIVDSTVINTQRGDGTMNVHVHPTSAINQESPESASLRTTSGAGRTDVFYVNHGVDVHRPIRSVHMSSMNADMYLTYKNSHYNGLIDLEAQSYTATGVQRLTPARPASPGEGSGGETSWTHYVGEKTGNDTILVKSRGWAGLYF